MAATLDVVVAVSAAGCDVASAECAVARGFISALWAEPAAVASVAVLCSLLPAGAELVRPWGDWSASVDRVDTAALAGAVLDVSDARASCALAVEEVRSVREGCGGLVGRVGCVGAIFADGWS